MRDGRTDRRTDGRSETSIPPKQLRCTGGIKNGYDNENMLITIDLQITKIQNKKHK